MRKQFCILLAVYCLSGIPATAQTDSISHIPSDTLLPFQQQNLEKVTITGKKQLVEQHIDKTVINVDAMIANTGMSALDMLEKTPGVTVDKDGNISLKGKQGVMVMLDGRPTYLSGQELANLLRGMESTQINQLELMTTPPAKYDAAGNSGVINIITKKNKKKGWNGSITSGINQGRYFRYNENLSLNYRSSKFSLTGNVNHRNNSFFEDLEIFRLYRNEDKSVRAVFEQESFMRFTRVNNNIKIGADYFLTSKTTLGAMVSGFSNPNTLKGNNISMLMNPVSEVDSIVESRSDLRDKWKNLTTNLNIRHRYDSTGKELSADLDFITYDVSNDQHFYNTSYNPQMIKQSAEHLYGNLPMTIRIHSGKIDYVLPLKDKFKLETGIKSAYVITDSKASYYNVTDNGSKPDYSKTNFFIYKENVSAAYVNIQKKLSDKLEMQSGLRYEVTTANGLQHGNPTRSDSAFKRSYDNLFPTVYLKYQLHQHHTLGFSLGRRIERPRYEDLNPFLFFIDKYTYGSGNPFLRPQFSDNYEITWSLKSLLTTTVNFTNTKDMFQDIFEQKGEYATLLTQGNIGKRQNFGISATLNFPVKNWLTSNFFFNYNYDKLQGRSSSEVIEIEAGNFNMNMNHQIKLQKGWGAEAGGWYRSKGIWGQIVSYPMGALNLGVSKQILKEKGSLKMDVRDLFYTQRTRGDINFNTTEAKFRSEWDSRSVNLSFTYRFGKNGNGNGFSRERRVEEQNRVKGGS